MGGKGLAGELGVSLRQDEGLGGWERRWESESKERRGCGGGMREGTEWEGGFRVRKWAAGSALCGWVQLGGAVAQTSLVLPWVLPWLSSFLGCSHLLPQSDAPLAQTEPPEPVLCHSAPGSFFYL